MWNIVIILLLTATSVFCRRNQVIVCDKQAAMETSMRIATDFVDFFNSGELGMIFKQMMKPGATLTGSTAHPDCRQQTTNMRTTLIEQYQQGSRIESIIKSSYFTAKDSTVMVNVAHLTGQMGVNPALIDVKFYLVPDEDCDYRIQSMTQTPYGCLKNTI